VGGETPSLASPHVQSAVEAVHTCGAVLEGAVHIRLRAVAVEDPMITALRTIVTRVDVYGLHVHRKRAPNTACAGEHVVQASEWELCVERLLLPTHICPLHSHYAL
jgi:hypothetical protein